MLSFEPITVDNIPQQIKRFDIIKATQESDISTKLVKRFDNIMVDYLKENVIVLNKVPSLTTLIRLWFMQPIKRTANRKNQNIDQLAFCLIYLKFMKNDQMYAYFNNLFPKCQYGFRK